MLTGALAALRSLSCALSLGARCYCLRRRAAAPPELVALRGRTAVGQPRAFTKGARVLLGSLTRALMAAPLSRAKRAVDRLTTCKVGSGARCARCPSSRGVPARPGSIEGERPTILGLPLWAALGCLLWPPRRRRWAVRFVSWSKLSGHPTASLHTTDTRRVFFAASLHFSAFNNTAGGCMHRKGC